MKTKILVIGPSSTHVERFVELVLPLFDEVVFVGEKHLETTRPIRQHMISFRSLNPFTIQKSLSRLRFIVEGENPDIIHIQQVNRVAYLASRILKKVGRTFVLTAWWSDVLVIPKKNWFYRRMTKLALRRAAFITADSRDMIAAIEKLAPGRRSALIFFGIVPLGSDVKEKLIFSNRALFPLYNIGSVITQFADFAREHPDWKLAIAGTGPSEDGLRQMVIAYGLQEQVEFCGWLKAADNSRYYRRSAIYVSLPASDGTSVSLLEAMSAGCVPVLSDLPVSHEWIKHGVNGIIHNGTANCFELAIAMNRDEVGKYNEKLILEKATTEIARDQLDTIYKTVARD